MPRFWLKEDVLDYWVLKALPGSLPGIGLRGVHAQACYLLRKNRIIEPFQYLPDDDDVLTALFRLDTCRRIEKVLRCIEIGGKEVRTTWYWTPEFRYA